MQERGFTPSVAENTIEHGQTTAEGDGVTVYYDPINHISVVEGGDGSILTISYGNLARGR